MQNKQQEEEILKGIGASEANARVLEMTEQSELLGWVAVDILDETLRMLKFNICQDVSEFEGIFYLDTLMRSAASFGETNGADKLATTEPSLNDFFKKRGFDVDSVHAFAPMSLIVHYE